MYDIQSETSGNAVLFSISLFMRVCESAIYTFPRQTFIKTQTVISTNDVQQTMSSKRCDICPANDMIYAQTNDITHKTICTANDNRHRQYRYSQGDI